MGKGSFEHPGVQPDSRIEKLALQANEGEEVLAELRESYARLKEHRTYIIAQIEASRVPRRHINNLALSSELDAVDQEIAKCEEDLHEIGIEHGIVSDELGEGIKRILN